MTKNNFAIRFAGMSFLAELKASRSLGCSNTEAFESAFAAHDETYSAVFAPEQAAVLPRFRMISGGEHV